MVTTNQLINCNDQASLVAKKDPLANPTNPKNTKNQAISGCNPPRVPWLLWKTLAARAHSELFTLRATALREVRVHGFAFGLRRVIMGPLRMVNDCQSWAIIMLNNGTWWWIVVNTGHYAEWWVLMVKNGQSWVVNTSEWVMMVKSSWYCHQFWKLGNDGKSWVMNNG